MAKICETPQQTAIWDAIEALIDATPADGIAADGEKSEAVLFAQRAYVCGLRSARLAAIRAAKSNPKP